MTRFVIDLGDIDMEKETIEELNADLQKTAMSYVARLRFEEPLVVKFPRPFPWGIIIRPELDDVLKSEKLLRGAFERLG